MSILKAVYLVLAERSTSAAPAGLWGPAPFPRACARGCRLPPLRGFGGRPRFHGLSPSLFHTSSGTPVFAVFPELHSFCADRQFSRFPRYSLDFAEKCVEQRGLSPEAVVCRPCGALGAGPVSTGFRPRLSSAAPAGLSPPAGFPRAFARGCRLPPLRGFRRRPGFHGLSPEAVVCRPCGAFAAGRVSTDFRPRLSSAAPAGLWGPAPFPRACAGLRPRLASAALRACRALAAGSGSTNFAGVRPALAFPPRALRWRPSRLHGRCLNVRPTPIIQEVVLYHASAREEVTIHHFARK